MKALLISPAYEFAGGAVIAANRLFHSLPSVGVESCMLAGRSGVENERVQVIKHNLPGEKLLSRITMNAGLNYVHYYSSFRISKSALYKSADVVNFHNMHSGYFNYLAIPSLTKTKPGVLTLHDMWSFTGHCTHSFSCERWRTGCGKCPDLRVFPEVRRDATAWEWKLKRRVYERSDLSIVAPSRWLFNKAAQSMQQDLGLHHIPYGLDTGVLEPLNKSSCRDELGIPAGKKILLFAAMGLDNLWRGPDLLVKALNGLPAALKKEVFLVTMGSDGPNPLLESIDIPGKSLGFITDDREKAKIFSAADIFLYPTRVDNLPCIVQESLACGTPVVSFNVGGVPDMVRPGITGYLAEAESTDDFRSGIQQLLDTPGLAEKLGSNCREVAVNEYGLELQAKRYKELFTALLH